MSGDTNRFALFYQSLVIFAVYRFAISQDLEYELHLQSVHIDGDAKNWGPTSLWKYKNEGDEFVFSSIELATLCGFKFHPHDIEIIELVDRWMRFVLLRRETYRQLYLNVVFSSNEDVHRFFSDIRSLQGHQWMETIGITRMFRYPISKDASQTDEPTLTPLSTNAAFYVKDSGRDWFETLKSFNFVRIVGRRTQEADLVIQSKQFNVSPRLGDDKYVLCANTVEYSNFVYVLLFRNASIAGDFDEFVKDDVNDRIPCSNEWLTPELIRRIYAPIYSS